MTEFEQKLRQYGADFDVALGRMDHDEEFYLECLKTFDEDPSYLELKAALEQKDCTAAFNCAHTLKGVAGNLGLTPLYQVICDLVEPLRQGSCDGSEKLLQAVLAQKERLHRLLGL